MFRWFWYPVIWVKAYRSENTDLQALSTFDQACGALINPFPGPGCSGWEGRHDIRANFRRLPARLPFEAECEPSLPCGSAR